MKPVEPRDLVWEKRILVISDSGPNEVDWFSDDLTKDLTERRLLVFVFSGKDLVQSNFDKEINPDSFLRLLNPNKGKLTSWALIGLDGGKKNEGHSSPNPDEIFRIIDAMPMRQSEIKRKGDGI
ncbi:DUF4174 domain-containing protein [Algoriphagus sp. oki45]|uniref:DUF4174 domain-containing protein n=1 Tax=Algoriphagus sp. oki45 TaxID=3067294 RepID=UPI0030C749A7